MPASTSASTSSTFSWRIDVLRSISAGSRPTFSHQSSRTPLSSRIVSTSPKPCQMSACSAVIRSVTFLPRPPMQIGMLPHRRRVELLPALLDDRQVAVEVAQAAADGAELVAVLVVVALEPARADAEDEAAVADVVDRARHVGEQVRVAVRVAGDEGADLRALRRLRERGQHRPALEVLAVRVAAQREEVIPRPQRLDAEPLGLEPGGAHVAPVAVLR